MQPTNNISAISTGNNQVENNVHTLICFAASWLNNGNNNAAIPMASSNEKKLVKTDSVRNCVMRSTRDEPATFLIPTSFARLAERAVDRFMKFTQAISKMKIAMIEKIYTYVIFPFTSNS